MYFDELWMSDCVFERTMQRCYLRQL